MFAKAEIQNLYVFDAHWNEQKVQQNGHVSCCMLAVQTYTPLDGDTRKLTYDLLTHTRLFVHIP